MAFKARGSIGGVNLQKHSHSMVPIENNIVASFVRNESKHTPGAPALVQTMDSLCRVYPYHIVVNAGDTFGGSYLYSMSREKGLVPQLFRDLNIQISALGNHEFDEGQEKLAAKWKGAELRPDDWNFTYVIGDKRKRQKRQTKCTKKSLKK